MDEDADLIKPEDYYARATRPDALAEDRAAFVKVAESYLQVRLMAARGEFICSAMAHFHFANAEPVDHDIVARFNAYHLFRGGYCMLVHPPSGSLYVNQSRSAASLNEASFLGWLADFANRSQNCIRWIAAEKGKAREEAGRDRSTASTAAIMPQPLQPTY